jgi:TPR repeat protein
LKRVLVPALAASAVFSLAYAESEPPPPPGEAEIVTDAPDAPKNAAPHQDDAGRLVMFARKLREEKGCAGAAPAFRVIAGMGEGQEAAQHELGECLLTMKGASDIETALFRQEGEFWLTRAAYAGNARAQRKLTMEMASPASALHSPKGSVQWALVYQKNPTADLYGYGPLPPTLLPGLKSSLSAVEIAEAEKFASDFAPLPLAKFEGPKREGKKGAFGERHGPPPGGRRRGPGLS